MRVVALHRLAYAVLFLARQAAELLIERADSAAGQGGNPMPQRLRDDEGPGDTVHLPCLCLRCADEHCLTDFGAGQPDSEEFQCEAALLFGLPGLAFEAGDDGGIAGRCELVMEVTVNGIVM